MTLPTIMTLMDRIKAALTHDFVWKSRNDKLTRSNATFGAKMKRKAQYQFVSKEAGILRGIANAYISRPGP